MKMWFEAGVEGLELNHTKTELVCDDIVTSNAVLSTFSDFKKFVAIELHSLVLL